MKKYFLILLVFVCVKSNAQKDSTDDSLPGIHIKYYSISNDSMRLSVQNANHVTIKQYKEYTMVWIYPIIATSPKNKIDTTIKKPK